MTLYEIDERIRKVLEQGFNGTVDEETGEVIEDIGAAELEKLQMTRAEKLEATALYIKSLDSLVADIKAEEEALKKRREEREAKAERLREYITASMLAAGETDFESGKVQLKVKKSEAVIVDEEKLDKTYMKETVKITTAPDKIAIKKAIKAGNTVTGAYIEERKKVQIK